MTELKYTLIADGSSDKNLIRIIDWSLNDLYPKIAIESQFADFRNLQKPPKDLKSKIKMAEQLFPFQILFLHRDAESHDIESRKLELDKQLTPEIKAVTIPIIPVRMMETWLLIDTDAIKKAAGNRNYKKSIQLPTLKMLEKETNPKSILHDLLKEVSGLKGRNLDKFNPHETVHLLSENIDDYSPLRSLDSFIDFEKSLKKIMSTFLS
ncbi:hypothetical protein [Flavobacterium kingsejongi]|uniref:DUF4276 domain-containing protein n=1 Tax=Flavobacterium kingsejongi TaxID=1678728 RepID=A0A2S1LQW9_9FLAO|nr:hypothetical protein [Flavobacterium kingsejongi]AWG26157.1 hypothetical protein FK004_13435 [Flavobacterium kingsejongi]